MKSKIILLSALFMGFIIMEKAEANCPQTISYKDYKKLKKGKTVDNYQFLSLRAGVDVEKGDSFDLLLRYSHDPHMCAYHLHGMGLVLPDLTIDLAGG